MALESATYISDLNSSNPAASDAISTADDHLRLIKSAIKATFPNIDGPVTVDQDILNGVSPVFTGTPEAPTADPGTDTEQIATTAFAMAAAAAAFPSGGIIMWSGSIVSVPSGWYLCDGTNGTPDLRNRFVVGAGSTYAVDATGGSLTTANSSVADTGSTILTESNLPSHYHLLANTDTNLSTPTLTSSNYLEYSGGSSGSLNHYTLSGTATTPTIGRSSSVGSGTGHTHTLAHTHTSTPPYYALAFIMKA